MKKMAYLLRAARSEALHCSPLWSSETPCHNLNVMMTASDTWCTNTMRVTAYFLSAADSAALRYSCEHTCKIQQYHEDVTINAHTVMML